MKDYLSRRTRNLLINPWTSIDRVSTVATIIEKQLGRDEAWQQEQFQHSEIGHWVI